MFSNDRAKAAASGLVALIAAISIAFEDGVVSTSDIGVLAGSVAAAFGLTWLVPNSVVSFAKAIAGAAGAGFAAWVAAGTDGSVTGNDWYTIAVAVGGGVAVYWTANSSALEPA